MKRIVGNPCAPRWRFPCNYLIASVLVRCYRPHRLALTKRPTTSTAAEMLLARVLWDSKWEEKEELLSSPLCGGWLP